MLTRSVFFPSSTITHTALSYRLLIAFLVDFLALDQLVERRMSSDHATETYDEYTERYLNFFNKEADDLFELTRGLNNAFCTDILPPPEVTVAALQCARRLNSFAVATRVLEGIRSKCEDPALWKQYLKELEPVMKELGVASPEELGR